MRLVLIVAAACAAIAAPAAGGDAAQWSLTGSGTGTLDLTGDHVMIGAHSDVGGANPRGHAENQGTVFGTTTFANVGGDVVCLRVSGNKALAVWHLRAPFTDSLGREFEYGAAYIEDWGEPVDGQPVDTMIDYVLRPSSVPQFCVDPATFAPHGAPALASGNFVVRDGS